MNADEIIKVLLADPRPLDVAKPLLPNEPGFYAWWTKTGSIPDVPACPHPSISDLHLFYVGISPRYETSQQTIRKRVGGNHMRGNTGGSTFRLTLASLLFETTGWSPVMSDRPLLTKDDNAALSAWQRENLRLSWAVRPRPSEIERAIIEKLRPPLNLEGNRTHPFAATVSAARKRFKDAAANPV